MEHSQIKKSHLIEKYISGRLEDGERRAFEEHYESCPQCQKALHRLINERDFAGRFVSGALSANEAAFFERHYFLCASCFAEVKQTEKIRLNILDSVRRKTFPLFINGKQSYIPTDVVMKIKNLFSSPYIAFASFLLILALLYPAWQGLRYSGITAENTKPQALLSPGFTLQSRAETIRGFKTQAISLRPNEKIFLINFNLPVKLNKQNIYRARIFNNQNRILWNVGRIRPNGPYETFSIACFRNSFTEGSYRLVVSEADAFGKATGRQFTFPFSIIIKN